MGEDSANKIHHIPMPQHYLLTCDCGQQLTIQVRQAGETRTCACGRVVEIPTLRDIRQLPFAPDSVATPARVGSWSLAHGVAFALAIPVFLICLGLIGHAVYQRHTLSKIPIPTLMDVLKYSPDDINRADIDSLTLEQTWTTVWKPLRDAELSRQRPPNHVLGKELSRQLFTRIAIAGVVALLALATVGITLFSARPRAHAGS